MLIAAALLPITASGAAQEVDACIDAVKKTKAGEFVKLESLDVKGQSVFEIEVKDEKGTEWEFMCDAASGKIIETEKEAESAESEEFKKGAKISEKEAVKIALDSYPGKVEEVEYEIEENGDPVYEIDIVGKDGKETKVEVDAATGKIIEVSIEKWEVGVEADEKR